MLSLTLAEGVEMRPLEPWQAAEFYAHVEEVRDSIRAYIPFAARLFDEDAARAYLQGFADSQAADGPRIYGIWVDGVFSGGTLFRIFDTGQHVCELGVWLGPWARGRGIITRAATAMIDWAVRERGMLRVEWGCEPSNEASIAAAKRIGFTYEATIRQGFNFDGRQRDYQLWSILADEWLNR
ncbi:GNAT family N-acetyltransferase [Actinomadura rupiterrae]|uniref:GNAT family N-acetyltransferase n=1 Tax=Actinomadura rupiterrae TaxID=559627 RepID=UPI0020A548AF|nr:GNAT family protein [Actinomadura rupiterrae]MCP2335503.1 RimJ/RimL family protein N-acetyltransferase [Actinomadura rupiterrae]